MKQVWLAQLALLPVQIGWAALYCWAGKSPRRWYFDGAAVGLASLVWVLAVHHFGAAGLPDGVMWAVILATTAGFLSFNSVLAMAALWRYRSRCR